MKINVLPAVVAGILIFIGGCEKDTTEQTTEADSMPDKVHVSASENVGICTVC